MPEFAVLKHNLALAPSKQLAVAGKVVEDVLEDDDDDDGVVVVVVVVGGGGVVGGGVVVGGVGVVFVLCCRCGWCC